MKALILGDVSPTKFTDPLFDKKETSRLFRDTATLFEGNDLNLVNLEVALTDHDGAIEKFGPALKASKNTAEVLKELGVNLCGLSNNHIFDFGKKGALGTMAALDAVGITYTGFGENYEDSRRNYVMEKNGETLCVIAVCEHEYSYALDDRMGSRPYDEYDTMKDIRDAKAKYDRVIVTYHGAKEMCRYPSPRIRKLCRAMIDNGADLVTTQHSHCIGCYESYEGGHILYGQGNFHFVYETLKDKEEEELWNSGLALGYDSTANTVTLTPYVVKGEGIELAKGEEKEAILSAFEKRNASLKDGTWIDGWRAFCESVRESYVKKVSTAYESEIGIKKFGHYLDCEAHTDVWRELYKTANHTNEK